MKIRVSLLTQKHALSKTMIFKFLYLYLETLPESLVLILTSEGMPGPGFVTPLILTTKTTQALKPVTTNADTLSATSRGVT